MKPRFKGKTVLVTGAGSGIGRATALAFAREGARVAVNDLGARLAETVRRKIRGGIAVPGDISRVTHCARIVRATLKTFKRLDILVNNAGIGVSGNVLTTSEEDWDTIMRVNAKGVFLLSREVLKAMIRRRRGVIVNTASVAGVSGIPDRAAYTASKHAVVGLTRAMALDHVKDGIRINCICPGTTMTPWIGRRLKEAKNPKAAMKALVARQPMGRLGKPGEMADAILFLASDVSTFTTGTALIVDGGFCA